MTSNASSTGRPDHILFCKENCTVKHSELILRLANCPDNKRLVKGLASLKQSLYEALQEGWNPHSCVTDPLEEFQWPLVHWACVLGKDYALEWLFKMNFRSNAVNEKTGETAVHQMLRRLYSVYQHDGISVHQTFNKFLHLLTLLTSHDSDVLFVQEMRNGNTALHECAQLLMSQEGATSELEYYEQCLTAILRRIASHDTESNASVYGALHCKNRHQKTVLHILAEKNISVNIVRYLMRKFRHQIDLENTDGRNRTALQIAHQNNAFSVVKVLEADDDIPVEGTPSWSEDANEEVTEILDDERCDRAEQVTVQRVGNQDSGFPSMIPTSEHHSYLERESAASNRSKETSSRYQVSPGSSVSQDSRTTTTHHPVPSRANMMTREEQGIVIAMDTEGRAHPVAIETHDNQQSEVHVSEATSYLNQSHASSSLINHNAPGDYHNFMSSVRSHSSGGSSETSEKGSFQNGPDNANVTAGNPSWSFTSPSVSPGRSDTSEGRPSCNPLIKLIHEERDVVTLLQARLEDKREKLRHDMHEFVKTINTKKSKESEALVRLGEVIKARDELVRQDMEHARLRDELLQQVRALESTRQETRMRLAELETKINELKRDTEGCRRDFAKRNECYDDMKRKLTDYDDALSEITGNRNVNTVKREKLS